MELSLLGPVQMRIGGNPVNIGVRKQRLLLAVLALEVNKPLPVERLIELIWPRDAPATSRGMVHSHVSGLRSVFANVGARRADVSLDSEGSGYALHCDPACIDAHRFRALLADARRSNDDGHRAVLLSGALDLWRGPALAGTATEEIRARLCHGLHEARLTAMEDLAEARLRLGLHRGRLDELFAAVAEYPLRTRLTGALMLALHQAGRTAEALETFDRARIRLREEFGIDPPVDLTEVHLAILRNEPIRALPSAAGTTPVPRQLPADLDTFIGRTRELDGLLTPHIDTGAPATMVISVIDGMAGVGKTVLAVRAAHRLADRFPDGQLFIDLHGFTPGMAPLDPGAALDRMLQHLGVDGARIPHELDARAAMYRTRVAGKRMLIVLDNATGESQVGPLLPGTPTCLVLITSRSRLGGLDNAHPLSLDVLPPDDAVALFTRIAGGEHPGTEAQEIAELCGRLPLAVRLAAAGLRHGPAGGAARLIERLRDRRDRLATLEAGDRSVAAAIDLSYRQLTAAGRRLYRLLGLHPGWDIDIHAAAALAHQGIAETDRLIDGLVTAHLVEEPALGRYRFHDLVRAHAVQTRTREEAETASDAALTRLYDYYAGTASAAVELLYPHQADQRPHPAKTPAVALAMDRQEQADAWLDAELANLLAVAAHAAGHDQPAYTVRLSTVLYRHLRVRSLTGEALTLHTQALAAAQEADDRAGELAALTGLGYVHRQLGRQTQAIRHFERALTVARQVRSRVGEIDVLTGLGYAYWHSGRSEQAGGHLDNALKLARQIGRRPEELDALLGLGFVRLQPAPSADATELFEQALVIAREIGHRSGELNALNGLGLIHRRLGRPDRAIECFESALRIAQDTRHRSGEFNALINLGHVHCRRGALDRATELFERTLAMAEMIDSHNYRFEGLIGLGHTHLQAGDPQQALARYLPAIELVSAMDQPKDRVRAEHGAALAHRSLGHDDHAKRHWRQALRLLTELRIPGVEEVGAEEIKKHLNALGA